MSNPFSTETTDTAADIAPAAELDTGDGAAAADTGPQNAPDSQSRPDPEAVPPLWSVMAAEPGSGASTLDGWCACSREITRDPAWRPAPGESPYLVLTTVRSVEGIRRGRQLAGALTATAGLGARVVAIVALAPDPATRPSGSGIQLKELIVAAEAAGVPILPLDHDPALAAAAIPLGGALGWSPQRADNTSVPTILARLYTRIYFAIADAATSGPSAKEAP
ncbi:hypothetical protein KO481_16460 [Nocardia sp. NEAU-G5]|uniref:Uncharacterized protein n=1 Tax=Nocardia albiluteola TaxID=2842303 RepID=A0ABS6AYN6_9NOCA|nr:hypothetical protein [Nocardia albiluteola]MBU3063114.1 hypothetical protein [Nocardia albiluteola]